MISEAANTKKELAKNVWTSRSEQAHDGSASTATRQARSVA
jgi:hypothetical protein